MRLTEPTYMLLYVLDSGHRRGSKTKHNHTYMYDNIITKRNGMNPMLAVPLYDENTMAPIFRLDGGGWWVSMYVCSVSFFAKHTITMHPRR